MLVSPELHANLLHSVLPVFYFVKAAVTGENKWKNKILNKESCCSMLRQTDSK